MLGRSLQRAQQAREKDFVVRGRAGASADHDRPLHHLGEERGPMIGLHAAHGKAVDSRYTLDVEQFFDEPMLCSDIVRYCHEERVIGRFGGAG
jgi:hypothetical protein